MKRAGPLIFVLFCLALAAPGAASAATASWRLEPSSFDFGTQLADEGPTAAASFRLENTGETSLAPELVSVTDQDGSGFDLAGNGCKMLLAPGAHCTIEVTFDPSSGGRKEGTLAVETTSPGVPAAKAQLIGSGGEPIVVIEPAAMPFDPVVIPLGAMPVAPKRTVTVRNVGTADLTNEGWGFKESGPPESGPAFFAVNSPVGLGLCLWGVVPPGESCTISFEFLPRNPGSYSATLELKDDASDSPHLIPLSGTASVQQVVLPTGPPAPPRASAPKLAGKPPLRTRSRTATFSFSAEASPGGFMCRLHKGKRFVRCTSPVHLHGLRPGFHVFSVRGVGANSRLGPITTYRWRIVD